MAEQFPVYCPGCNYPPWASWAKVRWQLCEACKKEQDDIYGAERALLEQREDDRIQKIRDEEAAWEAGG